LKKILFIYEKNQKIGNGHYVRIKRLYDYLKSHFKSKLIDEVVVSSNSNKILNYSKKFKKFALSKRPEKLSTKKSEIIDTIFFEMKKSFVK